MIFGERDLWMIWMIRQHKSYESKQTTRICVGGSFSKVTRKYMHPSMRKQDDEVLQIQNCDLLHNSSVCFCSYRENVNRW